MKQPHAEQALQICFIGSAGIPNRYGGFESFLEHCTPLIVSKGHSVRVTCDSNMYSDQFRLYKGVERVFLTVPANGGWSLIHDLLAFLKVFKGASHIVVLGVSGGLWFPIFRLLCDIAGKSLLVNVDGVEWRRTKFSYSKRLLLKVLDFLAQKFAHKIIYDNVGLRAYLIDSAQFKATCIAYSGDHVLRLKNINTLTGTALSICRIEPENNLEMLIDGALKSNLGLYTVIGNWNHSPYAQNLRKRYINEKRLSLLDPIYDAQLLAQIRESCDVYVHGHSVGGTNPSLVEMLFYDCSIFCFDVDFNRHTAGDAAHYFKDASSLALLLDNPKNHNLSIRHRLRPRYLAKTIADEYIQVMRA